MDNDEMTIEQEVAQVIMQRPHVVVLGAGASRAVCLKGDKNGKLLPLMSDLTKILGMKPLLQEWDIDPDQNFEDIFSDLHSKGDVHKIEQIQQLVEEYFEELELPNTPTIYDHLVLSLRDTDIVASFNWDPLLMEAYLRNRNAGLSLPRLVFLHGNVSVGYCKTDRVSGLVGNRCKKCGEEFISVPLLYPVKNKDYASDNFISGEWQKLKNGFKDAFMITIFGYSGPKTDQEAIGAMKEAWGNKNERSMEQTCFITPQDDDMVSDNWEPFIHTHHYELADNFYASWIANHPRRTGEAYVNQYIEAKFIDDNPIPKDADFPELWKWYEKFKFAENDSKKRQR